MSTCHIQKGIYRVASVVITMLHQIYSNLFKVNEIISQTVLVQSELVIHKPSAM